MKIALFSDIHANLPALESFFEDLKIKQPDAVYCLGDLVGYNIWPNEVVNAIRGKYIPTISGNHDAVIGIPTDKASGKYMNELIGESEKKYLLSLPEHIRLEYKIGAEKINVLLVHGSPRRNNEYLTETTEENLLLEMMQESNADILCFGHTHKPFHRILKTEKGNKHAINLGSLGKPKDGDQRGCYVLLDINTESSLLNKNSIEVSFERVAYDVEKAAKAVEASVLPNAFSEALREAK